MLVDENFFFFFNTQAISDNKAARLSPMFVHTDMMANKLAVTQWYINVP